MSTRFDKLKSGTMVVLHQAQVDGIIYARRAPEALRGPRAKAI